MAVWDTLRIQMTLIMACVMSIFKMNVLEMTINFDKIFLKSL